jgi:hypothetical protein
MADIGTGATLAYTGWPSYSILSISPSGASRAAVPSSHLGTTGGQTFIAGDTYDPGEIEVECIMDNEDPNTNDPPITDAAATLTITFPTISGDTAGATMAGTSPGRMRHDHLLLRGPAGAPAGRCGSAHALGV